VSATFAAETVAWLATFALHSTILVAIAALATRRFAEREPARAERVWVVALWAGLVTATVQVRTDLGPRWTLGSWAEVPATASTAPGSPASSTASIDGHESAAGDASTWAASSSPTDAGATRDALAASAGEPPSSTGSLLAAWAPTPTRVVVVWALGAGLGLIVLVARYLRFLASLRERRDLGGPAASELGRLARAAGLRAPRLTTSSRLAAPASFMLPRAEICLPERALRELDAAGRRAVLAHELAHIVRRDPLRLLSWRALEVVFFFQPLLRVARRRLVGWSETLCDEWAASRTGGRRELAHTLARVAGWVCDARAAAPVAHMAACRSALGRRVERLIRPLPAGSRTCTPIAWASVGLLAVALVGPSVACRTADAPEPEPETAAAATEASVQAHALEVLGLYAAELDALAVEIDALIERVERNGDTESAQRLRALDEGLANLRGRRDQLETTLSRMETTP